MTMKWNLVGSFFFVYFAFLLLACSLVVCTSQCCRCRSWYCCCCCCFFLRLLDIHISCPFADIGYTGHLWRNFCLWNSKDAQKTFRLPGPPTRHSTSPLYNTASWAKGSSVARIPWAKIKLFWV